MWLAHFGEVQQHNLTFRGIGHEPSTSPGGRCVVGAHLDVRWRFARRCRRGDRFSELVGLGLACAAFRGWQDRSFAGFDR